MKMKILFIGSSHCVKMENQLNEVQNIPQDISIDFMGCSGADYNTFLKIKRTVLETKLNSTPYDVVCVILGGNDIKNGRFVHRIT